MKQRDLSFQKYLPTDLNLNVIITKPDQTTRDAFQEIYSECLMKVVDTCFMATLRMISTFDQKEFSDHTNQEMEHYFNEIDRRGIEEITNRERSLLLKLGRDDELTKSFMDLLESFVNKFLNQLDNRDITLLPESSKLEVGLSLDKNSDVTDYSLDNFRSEGQI